VGNPVQPGRLNGHQAVPQSTGQSNHSFAKFIDPFLARFMGVKSTFDL
jgi:hypothetical protein